jgi:hypothetical protein
VAGLWRYPVKAFAAEPLVRADGSWHGLAGDRRWAFVRPDAAGSGFPWLTLRQRADLVLHRPRLVDPDRPDASPVVVATPDGDELDVDDPALAARLGPGVRALKLDRGTFDSAPLSLLTTRTVADLGALVGRLLDVGRFRPNLLVEPADPAGDPWPEDAWVGATLRAGGLVLRIDRRDHRCVVTDVDPATGARHPGVLRAVAGHRRTRLGVYATTVTPGPVAVGDPVSLVSAPGAGS